MAAARERFGTRLGFILSGIGGAVGLGNIWRFPQLTSENGGAAFVFVYVPLLIVIGIPLLWAELSLGQRGQSSAVGTLARLGGRGWKWVGVLLVSVAAVFLSYYTVIAGLALKYVVFAPTDQVFASPADFLARSVEGPSALGFHLFFTAASALVVSFGVSKGLERANLVMMPALLVIVVGLAAYAVTRPGAADGISFYLDPDLSQIGPETFQLALAQVFFSVGIGFGIMLTYASYVERGRSMFASAATIALSDLAVALVAGLMIFPLIFSQGLEGQVLGDAPNQTTALFLTLPSAFAAIGGALGKGLTLAFFLMLSFAALSSSIAALQVVVTFLEDEWGITRWKAAIGAGQVTYGVGIAAALSSELADGMDTFLASVMLFAGGILICLTYTFRLKDRLGTLLGGDEATASPGLRTTARLLAPIIMYVIPLVLFVLFLINVPATWNALFG